jgi:hypothetical protein
LAQRSAIRHFITVIEKEKIMNKQLIAATLAAAALAPMAANAQDASATGKPATAASATATATPTVGAKVFDPQGGEVGAIEKVEGANAVVYTGTKRATLPLTAFAKNDKGLLISMTQAQLNSAVAAAEAQTTSALATKIVADAPVKSKDGASVGTISKVEGDNVTIALTSGSPVTVTKQYLTVGTDGALALTMNSAEFKSAVAAAAQATPSSGSATAGATAGAATEGAETPSAGN